MIRQYRKQVQNTNYYDDYINDPGI